MNLVRLIKNIPLRLNEERSDQFATSRPLAWLRIYLSSDEYLICPDDALVVAIWRFHCFSRGGRAELKSFLDLARGCTRLLDLGASAGLFSALFANTRSGANIVSVEPDENSFQLLDRTVINNEGDPNHWRTVQAVMSDRPGTRYFQSGVFGGLISDTGAGEEMVAHSLESLSTTFDFIPDVIKIDVESYEHEILTGGIAWIEANKPRIFLELHSSQIESRGISPVALLRSLKEIGYVCQGQKDIVTGKLDPCGVARLALIAR